MPAEYIARCEKSNLFFRMACFTRDDLDVLNDAQARSRLPPPDDSGSQDVESSGNRASARRALY
jgi:hypothetical protein